MYSFEINKYNKMLFLKLQICQNYINKVLICNSVMTMSQLRENRFSKILTMFSRQSSIRVSTCNGAELDSTLCLTVLGNSNLF